MSKKLGYRIAIVLLLCPAMLVTTACSTAWVNTFDSILAAAAPALINILQIVAISKGAPFNSALAAKINGDATTMKSLAADFSKASATAAPTVCAQLQSAIQTYAIDQTQVLQLAQVTDSKTQTKITLLAGLVQGTVQAVLAVVPSCQAPPAALRASATPPLKLSSFIDDYNAVLTAPTGNAAIDKATPKMKLHKHSKVVHFLTFGRLT